MINRISPGHTVITDSRASAVLYRFLIQQPGRKTVLLPVNICSIVPAVIYKAGYDVEYVDIDPSDLCPDEEIILQKINRDTGKYSGILYNYTYGIETDKNSFYESLKNTFENLWLIEDKCSNMPGPEHSLHCDLTIYSTGYAKQVDLGYGGFGIMNEAFLEMAEVKDTFVVQADGKPYTVAAGSFPYSVDKYFKAIDKLMDVIIRHKAKLNAIYRRHLPQSIQLDERFQSWRFHILVDNKKEILEKIFSENLFASNHFKPMSQDRDKFPNAYNLHDKVINLFNDFYYTEEQACRTCEIINKTIRIVK